MDFWKGWPRHKAATAERPVGEDVDFDWLPSAHRGEAAWAHASGWMLLSGRRRRLSCVIPTCGDAQLLLAVLPTLCDCLTEAGFPWEMLLVDASGDGQVAALASGLARAVPLHVAASGRRASRADALLHGIRRARGDGVLLADTTMEASLDTVPLLIEQWAEGKLAVSCHALGDDVAEVAAHDMIDTRDFGETEGGLVLIDRSILAGLAPG